MPGKTPASPAAPLAATKRAGPRDDLAALLDWRPTLDPEKVRRRRTLLGLNQTELAERLGTNQGTYSAIERGERSAGLTLWRAARLCCLLGASIEELMPDPPPAARRVANAARRRAESAAGD